MARLLSARRFWIPILALGGILCGLGACSSDDSGEGGIVDPGGPPTGTPDLPTISQPGQTLPQTSAMLTTGGGTLSEFVPDITAAGSFLQVMNDASLCLEFRLVPGPCRIVHEGRVCLPTNLQWRYKLAADWFDLVPGSRAPCFEHLLNYGGSHYYISTDVTTWFVADVNCRLAGDDLATITGASEHLAVFEAIVARNPDADVYIGMFDWLQGNNNWKWRSTGEAATWAPWYPGEPNDYDGEYFAHIYRSSFDASGRWNDASGMVLMHYLMETAEPFVEDNADEVPVLLAADQPLYMRGLGCLAEGPRIERRIYWSKVFQALVNPGQTYNQSHSYTCGADTQAIVDMAAILGIPAGSGWATVLPALETALGADVGHAVDLRSEILAIRPCQQAAGAGETLVLALWQLRERYLLCDDDGQPWADPTFVIEGTLPVLDHGLEEDYLQIIRF